MPANLLLHCGAHAVSRNEVIYTASPRPTATWQPIPHARLLEEVETTLPRYGLRITHEAHALTHDGNRYFGLMEIQGSRQNEEYSWVLGLRNSNDQRFPAGLVVGNQVLVCDNLAFLGEITVSRKHTRFILRDLPELIDRAVGQLAERWQIQDTRIQTYKDCHLDDRQVHDLTIRALDRRIIAPSRIPAVLHEWRQPSHRTFAPRTAWSFFNAFTEILKQNGRLHDLPRRTTALYTLCDEHCGWN